MFYLASQYVLPCMIAFILGFALLKKVDIFDTFLKGATDGLSVGVKIVPTLILLMTCVGMFRASGAVEVISYATRWLTDLLHIPNEVLPLALLRPISGSGSLVLLEDLLETHGADSLVGQISSVMQGSTETTFYVIAVYFGATPVKDTRYTVFCALVADFIGFVASSFCVQWFLH